MDIIGKEVITIMTLDMDYGNLGMITDNCIVEEITIEVTKQVCGNHGTNRK